MRPRDTFPAIERLMIDNVDRDTMLLLREQARDHALDWIEKIVDIDEVELNMPLREALLVAGLDPDALHEEGRTIVVELEAYLATVTRHMTLGRMMIDELERLAALRVARGLPEFNNPGEIISADGTSIVTREGLDATKEANVLWREEIAALTDIVRNIKRLLRSIVAVDVLPDDTPPVEPIAVDHRCAIDSCSRDRRFFDEDGVGYCKRHADMAGIRPRGKA